MAIAATFLLLFACTLLSINQALGRHINPSSSSVFLGMTHSSSSLRTPKSLTVAAKMMPAEAVDIMEPLREVRDGYLINLNIGTPPQTIQVYMDTGSDLTWVPCGNLTFDCVDCDEYKNHKSPSIFSPSRSSSAVRDSCNSSFCISIHSSDNPYDPCAISGCSVNMLLKSTCSRPCPSFAYTYGEGGFVAGMLARDTIRVHGRASGGSMREIPRFCFGCVGSTYHEPIGIAGFGRGSLSFASQLGFLRKGFSHCFLGFKFANNPNVSSPLVIGDAAVLSGKDNSLMQFTPLLKSPVYPSSYYIGLESITVGNASHEIAIAQVPSSLREFDSQGNGGMLIDSGTTYTHLPETLYSQLLSSLRSTIVYPRAKEVEERSGFDLCYNVPSNSLNLANDLFPLITFYFLNNVKLVLPQGNVFYAMSAPRNSTVVMCLLFQSMDDGDYGPAGVFGSFQQQNVRVVYDLEKERIGFELMDCAMSQELIKRSS